MEYQITKEQCQSKISGVCSRCGGEITPLETVDNSNNPTFWAGCEKCMTFDNGVPLRNYKIATELYNGGFKYYSHIDEHHEDDENTKLYNKREHIAGTCSLVRDVLRINEAV